LAQGRVGRHGGLDPGRRGFGQPASSQAAKSMSDTAAGATGLVASLRHSALSSKGMRSVLIGISCSSYATIIGFIPG